MRGIKRFMALLFAIAMTMVLTPLFGVAGISYAEDEGDPFDFPVFDLEQITEGPRRLYDDGTISFRIPQKALDSDSSVTQITPFVGIPQEGPWESLGTDCYSYDSSTHIITIDGKVIGGMYPPPEYGAPEVIGVSFEAADAAGVVKWIAGVNHLEFWYSYVGDFLPEERTLLPGWDGSIDSRLSAWIEDSDHPYGEDVPVTVNNIEITDGADLLEDWHEDSDGENRWWYYRAGEEMGTVTFRLSYTDIDGKDKTCDYHVYISGDVYEADLRSEGNVFTGLPGSSINLEAWACHKYLEEDGERYTEEGLEFDWELEDNADLATLTPDSVDGSRAVLRFKEPAEGQDPKDGGVRVKVAVRDANDESAPDEAKIVRERWFDVRSDYYMIWPAGLDQWLRPGKTIENQQFELRHYSYGGGEEDGYNSEGFKTENIDRIRWDYDENAFSISKAGGGKAGSGQEITGCDTFSLKRLTDWGTGADLTAWYTGDDDQEHDIRTNYWFHDINMEVWFNEHDLEVYSDTAKDPQLRLDTGAFGEGAEADEGFDFNITTKPALDPGSDYTVTREGNDLVITFDRTKLDFDSGDIRVLAQASSKDGSWTGEERDAWLHLHNARYDIEPREHIDMLPGWDWSFDELHAYIENSEYPEGEDFNFSVSNVTVERGAERLDEVPTADNNWHLRVKDYGEVVLVLTYEDEHEDEQTYRIEINVTGEKYEINMITDDPVNIGLPGTSIELRADAVKKYINSEGLEEHQRDGFTYEWSIEYGGDFAAITPHQDDPSRAVLTFKEMTADQERIDEPVGVRVCLKDPRSERPGEEKDSDQREFRVSSDYTQVWPADIGLLNVGKSTGDITLKVRHYSASGTEAEGYKDGYKTYDVKSAEWHFDDEALQIADAGGEAIDDGEEAEGDTFTITRLAEWDTNIDLEVFYRDERNRRERCHGNLRLDRLEYGLWFDEEETSVYDDGEWTVHLQTNEDLDYSELDIRMRAFGRNGGEWTDAPDDCWSLGTDERSVTLYGEKMTAHNLDELVLQPEAWYNGRKIESYSDSCHAELRESCTTLGKQHRWMSSGAEYTDCTSPGILTELCYECGERKITEVDPRGHAYGTVSYSWAADNSSCTAIRVCANDPSHAESETATATLTRNGSALTYTAVFTNPAFATQVKNETDAAAKAREDAAAAEAAAEAARQGTPDPKLPKVKISAPKAAKKAITAKWKKLSKKQLKSGATNIEIWVCPDTAFGTASTKTATAGKKKASAKVKGLAKGTYYVKVRAIRKAGGVKYVGPWSKTKKIKVKK